MKSNTISKIDTWLDENIFHGKRDGMFIECGANDGKKDSISYSFEKNYGWKGVLIEPLSQLMKKCMNVIIQWLFWKLMAESVKNLELKKVIALFILR